MALAIPHADSPAGLRTAVESLPALFVELAELDNAYPQRRIRDAWGLWRADNARRARVDGMASDPDWRPDPREQRERGEHDHLLTASRWQWRHDRGPLALPQSLPLDDDAPAWGREFKAPRVSTLLDAKRGPLDGWRYWPALHDPVDAWRWAWSHEGSGWGELRNALTAPALAYWGAFASALARDVALTDPFAGVELVELDAKNAMTGESRPAGELVGSASSSPAASTQALPRKGRPSWD